MPKLEKVTLGIRVDTENYRWYQENFPAAGAFPAFVNQCLSDFRLAWGDRPTPDQIAARVAGNLLRNRY